MLNNIIDFFFQNRRFTIILSVIFLILGYKSYQNIAKEGAPQIKVPVIYISVYAEGFSPEDGERMLLKPMERELSKIKGVKNITAYSFLDNASVVVEFLAGTDISVAMNDVREKVDTAKTQFPQDVKEPVIAEVDLSAQPVLNVAILSNEADTMQIARTLKTRIEAIPSVLKTTIRGEKIDVVEVLISPQKMRQYGVSIAEIAKIQGNNKLISSGLVQSKHGEYSVKVPSLIQDWAEIKSLPIKTKNGVTIKLEDIANVKKTYKERATIARINGKDAVVIEVSKRSGSNIMDTIKQIHEKVDDYAKSLSGVVEILYMRDTSQNIKNSLNNLMNNIILAIIIVFIMVMNIVGFRQAMIISVSVPLSFFISIWIFYIFGISLNIVVLFGLVLSTGIIVDATSVIVEYASQKIQAGVSKERAYIEATHRMLWPIIISTVTVLIVSAPLLAWPGVIGGFMKYLPLTLIIVLTSSLFVALFVMPTLGVIMDKNKQENAKEVNIEDKALQEILEMKNATGLYARILNTTLKKPVFFLFVLLSVAFVIIAIFQTFNRGVEFFPNIETDYIRAYVRGVGNMSVIEKDKVMQEITEKIKSHIKDEVNIFYSYAGGSSGGGEGSKPKDAIGAIDIQLVSWDLRRKAKEIIPDLQQNISYPGFYINFDKQKDGPSQSTDINYEIYGYSVLQISKALDEMRHYLDPMPSLENIEDTRTPERIEYQVIVDKVAAMKYGIDATVIASYVKLATNGVLIDKFSESHLDDKTDIVLRYESRYRNMSQVLNSFVILNGKSFPVANFVKIKKQKELGEIIKKDGRLMYAIKANIKDQYEDKDGIVTIVKSKEKDKIFAKLTEIAKKHNVEIYASGTDEDQKETASFLQTSFSLALIVIFLIFVVQFNSVGYSVLILSSVFLSIVGVALGLTISQTPASIVMCGLGVISLAGIVVSNNLIYLDFFQTLTKNGTPQDEALIKAAILRGKAIILTSGTNVVGLLPAMFGINIDFATGLMTIGSPTSQWWVQLSSTIAGGLTFATALTLFFTPSNTLLYLKFKGYVFRRSNSNCNASGKL